MTTHPQAPWQYLSADICGLFPQVICCLSQLMNTPVIRRSKLYLLPLQKHCYSEARSSPIYTRNSHQIKTDNGPPFQSNPFAQFAQCMGFHHRKISPAWPKANSESCEHSIKLCVLLTWKTKIGNRNCFFICETTAPHPIPTLSGVSPAELLFGRKLVVKLPELVNTVPSHSLIADTDRKPKGRMKAYADTRSKAQHCPLTIGDTVLVCEPRKHKLSSP